MDIHCLPPEVLVTVFYQVIRLCPDSLLALRFICRKWKSVWDTDLLVLLGRTPLRLDPSLRKVAAGGNLCVAPLVAIPDVARCYDILMNSPPFYQVVGAALKANTCRSVRSLLAQVDPYSSLIGYGRSHLSPVPCAWRRLQNLPDDAAEEMARALQHVDSVQGALDALVDALGNKRMSGVVFKAQMQVLEAVQQALVSTCRRSTTHKAMVFDRRASHAHDFKMVLFALCAGCHAFARYQTLIAQNPENASRVSGSFGLEHLVKALEPINTQFYADAEVSGCVWKAGKGQLSPVALILQAVPAL